MTTKNGKGRNSCKSATQKTTDVMLEKLLTRKPMTAKRSPLYVLRE